MDGLRMLTTGKITSRDSSLNHLNTHFNGLNHYSQRLTEDISTFATSVAHLYGSLTKPCFDLMLIGYALMRSSQKMEANIVLGPALAFVVIGTTGHILRIVSPKFGQMVSEEANRYGYLRHIHSRIITNAEEIAFYGGHEVIYFIRLKPQLIFMSFFS